MLGKCAGLQDFCKFKVAVVSGGRVRWLSQEGKKLKLIKVALKEWQSTHTNNIPAKISQVTDHILVLDEKGEVSSLEEEKVEELHGLTEELHSLS